MAKIFILSAYETSAQDFFSTLLKQKTDLVLDVRLKNSNQLCGFTKSKDLAYLVPQITGARYIHDLRLAPEEKLLDRYLQHWYSWEAYAKEYKTLLQARKIHSVFQETYGTYNSICLLGTATKKRRSHSEVLAAYLSK